MLPLRNRQQPQAVTFLIGRPQRSEEFGPDGIHLRLLDPVCQFQFHQPVPRRLHQSPPELTFWIHSLTNLRHGMHHLPLTNSSFGMPLGGNTNYYQATQPPFTVDPAKNESSSKPRNPPTKTKPP